MVVKDFMTRKVVYISPDTTNCPRGRFDARTRFATRLPVIENDKLVGL